MTEIPMPAPQREMTEEDFQALMASAVWLGRQDWSGYRKKWVAVLGEMIIDSDENEEELDRRVAALGHTIDQYKVLTRYVGGYDAIIE